MANCIVYKLFGSRLLLPILLVRNQCLDFPIQIVPMLICCCFAKFQYRAKFMLDYLQSDVTKCICFGDWRQTIKPLLFVSLQFVIMAVVCSRVSKAFIRRSKNRIFLCASMLKIEWIEIKAIFIKGFFIWQRSPMVSYQCQTDPLELCKVN